jgi:hypothetical protein
MGHAAVAGKEFDRAHPALTGQVLERHPLLGEQVLTRARHRHRVELDHVVGRAELPAVLEGRRRRQRRAIAFGRALLRPGDDGRDFLIGERHVVGPGAHVRVGAPRWHAPRLDHLADRLRPRPRRLVVEQRHRSDVAGPVTLDAVGEENGSDVLAERHRSIRGRAERRGRERRGEKGSRYRSHGQVSLSNRTLPRPVAAHGQVAKAEVSWTGNAALSSGLK